MTPARDPKQWFIKNNGALEYWDIGTMGPWRHLGVSGRYLRAYEGIWRHLEASGGIWEASVAIWRQKVLPLIAMIPARGPQTTLKAIQDVAEQETHILQSTRCVQSIAESSCQPCPVAVALR